MNLSTLVLSLLIAASAQAQDSTTEIPSKAPNIIFLLSDDQNLLSVGCYGNSDVQTPQMDRLGKDGLIFDRHYTTTAICMASRANIFTGMYEYKTGTNFTHGNMRNAVWEKSYPVLLREAGYLTAFAGKFGIEVEGKGANNTAGLCADDFDFWAGGPGQTSFKTASNKNLAKYAKDYPHSTLAYGAFSQDVIKQATAQKKPFCLSISFKAPHKPATPDPRFNDIYKGKTFTKPANFGREYGEHLAPQSKTGRQYPRFTEWNYDRDYDGEMAKYYQQIYAIDVAIGMVRAELEAQGIARNTVIIYTSDNGYICGAHGYGSKVLPMEESSRVPLIIYDPRSTSAGKEQRCPALTGNIDFAPTLLELAGLPIPSNTDGVSLLPLLNDPTLDVREKLALMNTYGPQATSALTLLTKEMKYTYWWYGDKNMAPTQELFNLKADPLELKNLATAPEYASQLKLMQAHYDDQLEHLKAEVVPYNNYQQYGQLFDRHLPLSKKNFPKKTKKSKQSRQPSPSK